MTTRDDDLRIRPGRIQHGNKGAKRPLTFVGEVMRAAKKAGHTGKNFRGASGSKGRSTFGRGRTRGTLPVIAIARAAGRHNDPHRAPPGQALYGRAARQACRLSEA